MVKTFEELKDIAEATYEKARNQDRDHAVLTILEVIAQLYADGNQEMLDAVRSRFANRATDFAKMAG